MITRRFFVSGIGVAAAIAAIKKIPKFGAPWPGLRLHANDAIRLKLPIKHVYLNGFAIERRCREFHSGEGWADCYRMSGNLMAEPHKIDRLHGTITTDPPIEELARHLSAYPFRRST